MTDIQDLNNFDGLVSSEDIRTGFISGATFKNKPIQYSVVDGLAMFEGCIVLGTVEEMEAKAAAVRAGEDDEANDRGVFIVGEGRRWPNGIVPYDIDGNLPKQERISHAIAHWEAKTSIRFVRRTSGNASQYPNYIYFRVADGCFSSVGMTGRGKQDIGLAGGCGNGATIHEIGHALGLWHEQSREDRDRHIRVNWENIESDHQHNFNQHITDGDDHGNYDYDSIMHYSSKAFSKNGQPTIVPIDPAKNIGQRESLSHGDIATIKFLYQGAAPNARAYTIQSGDTLFLVAERELGDGNRWREIMKTPNGGTFSEEEARNLSPGQVVYLPVS